MSIFAKLDLSSAILEGNTTGKQYYDAPLEVFSADQQEFFKGLIAQLTPIENFNFNQAITVLTTGGLFFSGFDGFRVYYHNGFLSLKIGGNLLPIVYDAKKKTYSMPSGFSPTVGMNPNGLPQLQFNIGEDFFTADFAWDKESIEPIKANLRSLFFPLSPEIGKYVRDMMSIAAPLYTLIRGAEKFAQKSSDGTITTLDTIPPTGCTFQIVDIARKLGGKFGTEYNLILNPDHLPKHPLYDVKGNAFQTNTFRATKFSQTYLENNFDTFKASLKDGSVSAWLVITGFKKTDRGMTTDHTIIVRPDGLPAMIKPCLPVELPSVFVPLLEAAK
jgi:hypothetical protein